MGNVHRTERMPGSYGLEDSELFAAIAPVTTGAPKRLIPELRIGRPVNLEDPTRYNWHQHLDKLGSKNYGKGKAFAYGSMVLTYVTAKETSIMFDKKFPDLFSGNPDAKRILANYRSFARDYNQFVRDRDKDALDIHALLAEGGVEEDALEQAYRMWGVGVFAVARTPHPVGKNDLALVFTAEDDEILRDEMNETKRFCKKAGLDAHRIDAKRMLHISKFETFMPIGTVVLKTDIQPDSIGLLSPHALVNDNPTTR